MMWNPRDPTDNNVLTHRCGPGPCRDCRLEQAQKRNATFVKRIAALESQLAEAQGKLKVAVQALERINEWSHLSGSCETVLRDVQVSALDALAAIQKVGQ